MNRPACLLSVLAVLALACPASRVSGADGPYQAIYDPAAQGYAPEASYPETVCPPGAYGIHGGAFPAGYAENLYSELLPQDRGGFYRKPWIVLGEALSGTWARIDYLHFSISEPTAPIGASKVANAVTLPNAGIGANANIIPVPIDADEGFAFGSPRPILAGITLQQKVNAAVNGDATIPLVDFGVAPTFDFVDLSDNSGLRGSIGIPFWKGTIEGNVWFLEKADSEFLLSGGDDIGPLPEDIFIPPQILPANTLGLPAGDFIRQRYVVIPLLTNGQFGEEKLLFDTTYSSRYSTEVFGAEASYYSQDIVVPHHVSLQGLIGGRYLRFDEMFGQTGVRSELGQIAPPLTTTIDSFTENDVVGPQIGMRAEAQFDWLRIGVEPKVMYGINSAESRLHTVNLRSTADGIVDSRESEVRFTPVLDLSVYAHLQLREWFSVRVGYQIMHASDLLRPEGAVFYNDLGLDEFGEPLPPAVTATNGRDSATIGGLVISAEILFP